MQFAVRPPNKQRLLDALHLRESEEISYYEVEFHPSIISAILDKPMNERSYMMPVTDYIEFAHRVGLDVCRFGVGLPLLVVPPAMLVPGHLQPWAEAEA